MATLRGVERLWWICWLFSHHNGLLLAVSMTAVVTASAAGNILDDAGSPTVCRAAAFDIQDGKCHDRICRQSRWVVYTPICDNVLEVYCMATLTVDNSSLQVDSKRKLVLRVTSRLVLLYEPSALPQWLSPDDSIINISQVLLLFLLASTHFTSWSCND